MCGKKDANGVKKTTLFFSDKIRSYKRMDGNRGARVALRGKRLEGGGYVYVRVDGATAFVGVGK